MVDVAGGAWTVPPPCYPKHIFKNNFIPIFVTTFTETDNFQPIQKIPHSQISFNM